MKPSEILKAAKAVIENPIHWTTNAFARDAEGNVLEAGYDEDAVCFCSLGAIEKVIAKSWPYNQASYDYLSTAAFELDDIIEAGVADFNDSKEHSDVMQMFDKAIALAEAEGN